MTEVVDAMNAQDMLDYALGQLDGPSREQAEREVAADPALAERVDRLGRAIDRLLDDGLDPSSRRPAWPGGPLSLVAERRRRRRSLSDYLPVDRPVSLGRRRGRRQHLPRRPA